MKCPQCKQPGIRVTDTIDKGDHRRRYYMCPSCGARSITIERFAVFMSTAVGYAEAPVDLSDLQPHEPPAPAAPAVTADDLGPGVKHKSIFPRYSNFFPICERTIERHVPDLRKSICSEAIPLLIQWWNNSRKAKHGKKAVWTLTAFVASAERVAALPPGEQVRLCKAGVEYGWMALKVEYIGGQADLGAKQSSGLRNPASQEALRGVQAWA
jgi:hypothetical protein